MSQATATFGNVTASYGGWTTFRAVTDTELAIFNKATEHMLGVDYVPLLVSTQVVAGINYNFKCVAQVLVPGASEHNADVTIFEPLTGDPKVTNVTIEYQKLDGQLLVGAWSAWQPIDAKSSEVFQAAMQGIVGVDYIPQEVSHQVVEGMNYKFKCDAQVVSPGAKPYQAIVVVYVGLAQDGKVPRPIITDIQSSPQHP